jgi:hypothetical protein
MDEKQCQCFKQYKDIKHEDIKEPPPEWDLNTMKKLQQDLNEIMPRDNDSDILENHDNEKCDIEITEPSREEVLLGGAAIGVNLNVAKQLE